VLSGQRRRAEEILRALREAFGRESVFVELSDNGTTGSRRRLARVATFAREVGAPPVAAGEVAYL
jgi:error-prone DNA polymerase